MTRGDVFVLRPERTQGHEQAGQRYGVIVQSHNLRLSTVVIVPTSTSGRRQPFRPEIEVAGQETRALVEQIKTVDAGRLGDLVGHLTPEEMEDMDYCLQLVLGLY